VTWATCLTDYCEIWLGFGLLRKAIGLHMGCGDQDKILNVEELKRHVKNE